MGGAEPFQQKKLKKNYYENLGNGGGDSLAGLFFFRLGTWDLKNGFSGRQGHLSKGLASYWTFFFAMSDMVEGWDGTDYAKKTGLAQNQDQDQDQDQNQDKD
jgi:hypothetical protein